MSDNARPSTDADIYTITLNGKQYVVEVREGGEQPSTAPAAPAPAASSGETITAPLAGNIFKVNVREGDSVEDGDVVIILEA
ncbi:biotin/lipoyl-binding protein, partial [Halomonas aquatica]|uniref:biotin/lipoyl-containing protein n=1 Tax=Halomonas aquatica TaxID=3151123 RepID=UPI003D811038